MRVLKFGGTSVADAAAIHRVVSIVGGRRGARVLRVHDWFSAEAVSASAGGAR